MKSSKRRGRRAHLDPRECTVVGSRRFGRRSKQNKIQPRKKKAKKKAVPLVFLARAISGSFGVTDPGEEEFLCPPTAHRQLLALVIDQGACDGIPGSCPSSSSHPVGVVSAARRPLRREFLEILNFFHRTPLASREDEAEQKRTGWCIPHGKRLFRARCHPLLSFSFFFFLSKLFLLGRGRRTAFISVHLFLSFCFLLLFPS